MSVGHSAVLDCLASEPYSGLLLELSRADGYRRVQAGAVSPVVHGERDPSRTSVRSEHRGPGTTHITPNRVRLCRYRRLIVVCPLIGQPKK